MKNLLFSMLLTLLSTGAAVGRSIYDFSAETIDGKIRALSEYKGQVVLIINTASKCGFTKQYDGLQKLYEKYKDRGFVILGFPANNFMGQEPGTNEGIAQFCSLKFGVTFPMFGKISVRGKDLHPLYAWLTAQSGKKVSWNFNKFLIGRDGQVIEHFGSRVAPDDEKLTAAIEAALKPSAAEGAMGKAVFSAGCFWGVESAFRTIDGVIDTQVGYTGGTTETPIYKEVCSGKTGHAEAVEITFDPAKVSYAELVEVFWRIHNPTQVNRQGPDRGRQYRSSIFYLSPEQKEIAEKSKAALEASKKWSKPIATQIVPAGTFWRAEEYHQHYFEKNGGSACHFFSDK